VQPWLRAYGRWQRYGDLPDDAEQTRRGFDLMTWALDLPRMDGAHG
jgi:hypothetical protein